MKQKKRTIKYLKNAAKNGTATSKRGRKRPKQVADDQDQQSPDKSPSIQAKDTVKQ
jgi:hypothetical protein